MTSVSSRCHHWVIGDVHGCAGPLEQLLERLPSDDRLVFCGDAINRGPAIASTMARIWGLVEQGRAVWLKGNHEADLVQALRRGPWGDQPSLAGCDTYRHLGDHLCRATFNVVALQEVHQLAVLEQGHGRAAGRIGQEMFAGLDHGIGINTGEHSDQLGRALRST